MQRWKHAARLHMQEDELVETDEDLQRDGVPESPYWMETRVSDKLAHECAGDQDGIENKVVKPGGHGMHRDIHSVNV